MEDRFFAVDLTKHGKRRRDNSSRKTVPHKYTPGKNEYL